MAGNAVVGAVRVIFGADTALLEKGIKSAESSLGRFSKNVGTIAAGIGLEKGIEKAVESLVGGLKHAFTAIDELGKTSQKIGVPIEELSKMSLAAELSGVSMEGLSKGMGKLAQTMFNSTKSATEPAAQAFKRLGISAVDAGGNLRPAGDVMADLAGKFAEMNNGAAKTALAMQLFGKSGKDLIPMLNSGRDGLKEAAAEAEAFGLVISQRTFLAVELFNDNLTRLGKISKGVANTVVAEVAPVFALLTSRMVQNAKESGFVKSAADAIVSSFINVTFYVLKFGIHLQRMNEEITLSAQFIQAFAKDLEDLLKPAFEAVGPAVTTAMEAVAKYHPVLMAVRSASKLMGETSAEAGVQTETAGTSFARTSAVLELFREAGERARNSTANLSTTMQDISEQARMMADHMANTAKGFGAAGGGAEKAKDAMDQYFKSLEKSIAGQRAEAQTVGMGAGAKEALKVVLQGLAVAQENNIALTDKMRERLAYLAGEARNAAMTLAGAQLTEESLQPWQKYEKQLQNINELFAAQKISAETAAEASKLAAEKAGVSWDKVATGAIGGFKDLANEFGKTSKEMFEVGKALAIVEATINTYVAFTKALATGGPILGPIMAAGVLAAGLAKVIAIKSMQPPKAATGGILRFKGAAPGPDSQLMQARVRPDEEVEVLRPGERAARAAGEGTRYVTIMVDSLSRPFAEALVPALNDVLGDGMVLNVGTRR